jgi:hypothetical protein
MTFVVVTSSTNSPAIGCNARTWQQCTTTYMVYKRKSKTPINGVWTSEKALAIYFVLLCFSFFFELADWLHKAILQWLLNYRRSLTHIITYTAPYYFMQEAMHDCPSIANSTRFNGPWMSQCLYNQPYTWMFYKRMQTILNTLYPVCFARRVQVVS